MSTIFKSGVTDIQIVRFAGKGGANLLISRRNKPRSFTAEEILHELNNDELLLTLDEAKEIGETLIALSSSETSKSVEIDYS